MIVLQMDFASQLKKRRQQKGWTQQQLAIKSGVTRSNIAAYEEGRSEPRLQKFFKICKAFGITEILNTA